MDFEFDPAKSDASKKKHGIDFVHAQALWLDEFYLEIMARSDTELRYLVIGKIETKHYSAIITFRHDAIRIISVRRSRKEEVELYESRRIG